MCSALLIRSILLGAALLACSLFLSAQPPARILPLGNSITNGTAGYNSYRRPLWKMLHAAGMRVDFIGSWNKHHGGGEMPDPDFDMDHEGHSGWTAADMFSPPSWDSARGNIHTWLEEYTPDIVLLELGANDVFQCRKPGEIIADFNRMIDLFRKKNRRVTILIATVLPFGGQWATQKLCKGADLAKLPAQRADGDGQTYAEAIQAVNRHIVFFAGKKSRRRSPVRVADLFSAIDPQAHLYDGIHPNEEGEKIIAGKWFDALQAPLAKYRGGLINE